MWAAITPAVVHAQSSLTVYGLLDANVRYASNAGPAGGHQFSVGDGAFTGSRLGFKGSEDVRMGVGMGLKSLFGLEMGFDPSTGRLQQANASANYGQAAASGGRVFGREAWVGLSSATLGTLQMGRQYTLAHALSSRFGALTNQNADAMSVFAGHHVVRQDNMAKYSYQAGPWLAMASLTAGEGNGKAWSAGGGYAAGALDVVAYAEHMDSSDGAETRKVWGAGGSCDVLPTLTLYAGYMQRTQRVSPQRNDAVQAMVDWAVAPGWQLSALVAQDRQRHVLAGSRQLVILSAAHAFSKRTDAYVELDRNRLSGAYPLPSFMATRDVQRGIGVGLRHRF